MIPVFKNGWRTDFKRLSSKMGLIKCGNFEKAGSKMHPRIFHPKVPRKMLNGGALDEVNEYE